MTDLAQDDLEMPASASLQGLVVEALDLLEREGEAALEAFLAARPGQAAGLRRRLDSLRAFGFTPAPGMPTRLGGFRLLRKLGGGGMGVVHVAVQEGLGREVALKLVRPELLYFAGAKERFRRELEALARLQHPGIVPVFAGGEEGGVPYLAMELVRGATLEEALAELAGRTSARLLGRDLREAVIAVVARKDATRRAEDDATRRAQADSATELVQTGTATTTTARRQGVSSSGSGALPPLFAGPWTACCLRLARSVAEALSHAHEQGVLHRDVKPSNIMVTPDGRVLLLDFGLASAAGSSRLTGTGQALGSPAYMSPEQMGGDAGQVDARADVYGLGVTLYELLTLRQPFVGASIEETRRRVLAASPAPPRTLNTQIPRDAETVVLVAMDRDAPRRYADPAAFADDLLAVLELRPVHARRPSTGLRAQRWAQRHPALTVALVAGLLLVVGGPLAYAVQQREAGRRIQEALDETARQRDLATANFERAERAVDVLLTEVAESELLDVPHLEPVRRRILESALAFYEELLEQRVDDPALRLKVAHAASRVGYLLNALGRAEEALSVHERQLALTDAALAQHGSDGEWLALRQEALVGRMHALVLLGRFDEADASSDAALEAVRARWAETPDDTKALSDLDDVLSERAYAVSQVGDPLASIEAYSELAEFEAGLLEQRGEGRVDLDLVADAVQAFANMAAVLRQVGRTEDAAASLARAVELMLPARDALEASPTGSQAVTATLMHMGLMLGDSGRRADGESLMREALAVIERTASVLPNDIEVQRLRATAWNNIGKLLTGDRARVVDAREALEQALDAGRRVVASAPDVPLYRANLGKTWVNLGAVERDAGRPVDARAAFEQGWTLLGEALARVPDQPAWNHARMLSAWHLALVSLDEGDADGAAEAAGRIAAHAGDDADSLRLASGLLARAAEASLGDEVRRQRAADALAWLAAAVDAGYADAANLRSAVDLTSLRGERGFGELVARVEGGR